MAAAAVLPPSSGLSTPSDLHYTSSIESSKMEELAPISETRHFLTTKMVAVLKQLAYNASAINTLITRADSNTILATGISPTVILDEESQSISDLLEASLLDRQKLREQNIYLNSNEPVLLVDVARELGLNIQEIRTVQEKVVVGLRECGIKPVRVYIRETDNTEDEEAGLSFSLLNVVNSDIGVNMVSLLDRAFYGSDWKEDLIVKEGWNGYDLIWRDEAWKDSPTEKEDEVVAIEPESLVEVKEVPVETNVVVVNEATEIEAKQEPLKSGTAGAELQRMPSAPVRGVSYKSVDDVPEDTDEEEPEPVQHPALKELLEREAQRSPVQYPTWSRAHDSETYLDIIKTHSRGQNESEPISTISHADDEKDDFEVVDRP